MKPDYHRVIMRFTGTETRNLFKESGARYEDVDFRPVVMKTLQSLFKDYDVIEFSSLVEWSIHPDIRHRPDLAMISKNRRKWFIIEVELKHHTLGYSYSSPMNKRSDHIYPQVEVLAQGNYNQEHIDKIAEKLNVASDSLSKLLLYPPEIVVIGDDEDVTRTDDLSLNWSRLEQDFDNVHLAFVETYKWDKNSTDSCFIYSGWRPKKDDSVKIRMKLDNIFPSALRSLKTEDELPLDHGIFEMTIDGISTTWQFDERYGVISPEDQVSSDWMSRNRETKLFEITIGDEIILKKI